MLSAKNSNAGQGQFEKERRAKEPWRHDLVYHHMGLQTLIDVGDKGMKPSFDIIVRALADRHGAAPRTCNVKGWDRGISKVTVRYGGDASHLSNVVDGNDCSEAPAIGRTKAFEATRRRSAGPRWTQRAVGGN